MDFFAFLTINSRHTAYETCWMGDGRWLLAAGGTGAVVCAIRYTLLTYTENRNNKK